MRQALKVFFCYIEPVFVFVLFAAVPIARTETGAAFSFPDLSQGVFLGISGIWLWMSRHFFTPAAAFPCPPPSAARFLLCGFSALAFLCASGVFFFALAGKTDVPDFDKTNPAPLIAVLAIAAFFEEILYRAYLPAKARALFRRPRFRFAPEIFCVILFSAAHLRGGVFSALNALFAGAALQICFAKTKSVAVTGSVHAAYNIAALAWLSRG